MTRNGPTRPALEIAVQDVLGVSDALDSGTDRVELCQALELGGLTPSAGLVQEAVVAARTRGRSDAVHVLIRPRAGGFTYTATEVATMVADVKHVKSLGADGVVIGALHPDGAVDISTLDRLVRAAAGLSVTFHRALDVVPDPAATLHMLTEHGVRRVLTSGGASRTIDGVDVLARLRGAAPPGMEIMAGGGVRVEDIAELVRLGVDAVHLSARRELSGEASGPGGGPGQRWVTDPHVVTAAAEVLRQSV
jgi:copper homeostasis protein